MGWGSKREDDYARWAESQESSYCSTARPCIINQHKISENGRKEIKEMDELSQLRKQNKELKREIKLLKSERDKLSIKYGDLEYQNKMLIESNTTLKRELERERELRMKAENEQFINNWNTPCEEEEINEDKLNELARRYPSRKRSDRKKFINL